MTLADLPEIQYTEQQMQVIRDRALSNVEAKTGRIMNRADPERILFLALVDEIIQLRILVDQLKKSNSLKYSRKEALDHMGAFSTVTRLMAQFALTTLRFTISRPQLEDLIIPAGTRVGVQDSGGSLYFSTTQNITIRAGELTGDGLAFANVVGISANGFIPGQINAIMDPLPYVTSAINITESAGGSDEESDDSFRERIHLSPETFSVAGPRGAYIYWAKTASPLIIDVEADSLAPSEMTIVPLLQGGELPTPEIINAIYETLNNREVRPLTDKVIVQSPEVISYDIDLTYYISSQDATEESNIKESTMNAFAEYQLWQRSKLGRDINPSELIFYARQAGSSRIEVRSPFYVEVGKMQVAQEANVNLVYGGLVDD